MTTTSSVIDKYRAEYPLLANYLDAVHGHTALTSINTPADGIDVRAATRIALNAVGRPARDDFDVDAAYRFIRSLLDEAETQFPETDRTITHYVINGYWPLVAHVPTVDDWLASDEEGRECDLEEIMRGLPDHTDKLRELLHQALAYAMPAILGDISRNDPFNKPRLVS